MKENKKLGTCHFDTERLIIKTCPFKNDTEKDFNEDVLGILTPKVTEHLPSGWQNINSINDVDKWIDIRMKDSHVLIINLNDTHELIGFVFLYESASNEAYDDLKFGYLLTESMWGKGYGSELIQGLVKWCYDNGKVNSISGGVSTTNIASIKVLEKCGFSVIENDDSPENVVFYDYKFC